MAFHMRSWESVKELQALCGRLDFKHLLIERKLLFLSKMLSLKMMSFGYVLTVLIALVNAVHYVTTMILMLVGKGALWVL